MNVQTDKCLEVDEDDNITLSIETLLSRSKFTSLPLELVSANTTACRQTCIIIKKNSSVDFRMEVFIVLIYSAGLMFDVEITETRRV
jgi:hypothetical protein